MPKISKMEFIYDESKGTFTFPNYSEYVKSNLEVPCSIERTPSKCLPSSSTDYVYEARIICDKEDPDNPDNGKVIFMVLNKDKDFVDDDTCGGSFVKRFLLWLPRRDDGRDVVGVSPALKISMVEGPGEHQISVTLTGEIDSVGEGGTWCGRPTC